MRDPTAARLSPRQLTSAAELRSPKLVEALAYWDSKRVAGTLPSRGTIDPLEMKSLLDRVMLVDVEEAPRRYRYRLVGTLVTMRTGRDVTGRYWDEIYTEEQYGVLTASLDRAVETRAPCRSTGTANYVGKTFVAVEALDLPLSSDGEAVDMILRVAEFGP